MATACGEVVPGFDDGGIIDAAVDAAPGAAMLTTDHDRIDFGMLVLGAASPPTTVTITNTGNAASGALVVAFSDASFSARTDTCSGMVLQPAATCAIGVIANLTTAGPASGSLTVNGTPGGRVTTMLLANGLAPGALTMMPGSHDYLTVVGGTSSAAFDFTVANSGGVPTGNVAVVLSGPAAAEFEIVTDTCSAMPLGAQRTCTVSVRLRPPVMASGIKNAVLTAMATPGGAAMAMLTGVAQRPALIAFGGMNGMFGDVPVGTAPIRTITVTNNGEQTTGALAITKAGSAAFVILGGVAGDCATGMTMLAGGASCNLRVQFTPIGSGASGGMLTVTGAPGGTLAAALSGNGQRPPTLSANAMFGFGAAEVGTVGTSTFNWTITNTGDLPTSLPTLTASMELDVTGNSCTAALAPTGTCSMRLAFKPSTGGPRTATATLAVTGSMVTFTGSATGLWRVTVGRAGSGGAITTNPAGIACAPPALSCTALFAPGSVTIQARPSNGSGVYFGAWSGASAGTCVNGPNRDCVVDVDGPEAITGTFNTINANLAFVSAATFATNLGGVQPYDNACNALATAAGINSANNNNFIAWISIANSTAGSRLGAVAAAIFGWQRMDGRVFATTYSNLLAPQILNPLRFTETGADVESVVMTGTNFDGSASSNCLGWTSTSGTDQMLMGISMSGGTSWTAGAGYSCNAGGQRIMCLMKQFNNGVTAATFSGKKVWISNAAYSPSANGNPDTTCNADRPATAASGRALISRTTSTAASLLTANQMYVRPDGQEVGTGAEIAAGQGRGGIWQAGNGTYPISNMRVWTGSTGPTQLGTVASTCGNWVDSSQNTAIVGYAESSRGNSWNLTTQSCNTLGGLSARLYCYEP